MKLLYLSCHSILEYDELKLFGELGIDYFSLGSYVTPNNPVDKIRPALPGVTNDELLSIATPQDHLTSDLVNKFDVVVVMHIPEWITANWQIIKNKRVIWRSIGQSTPENENRLRQCRSEGLQVVRYSPREQKIATNIGLDACIRFYKDQEEFDRWNGAGNEVITFSQDMKRRGEFCNYNVWEQIVRGYNVHVYGPNNDTCGELDGGMLTYDDMKQKMRDGRVYIYTGTQPASYTLNFIEALMTGIPIVAIGPKYANSLNIAGETYEIPDIIKNGINGFWSDDINELRSKIDILLKDISYARAIGRAGRETAIKLFSKETIKKQWKDFLKV